MTGDLVPSGGRIQMFSEDITRLPAHQRIRRGLRRTYQTSLVFPELSVLDNLFLAEQGVHGGRQSFLWVAPDNPHRQRAQELAEFVGLESWIGTLAGELSHGQKRQLEIGMALAGQPRLVLFDEPAAGLSQSERGRLREILFGLPRSITFVIIEHDLEVALSVADRITVLHQGAFFRSGTPAEIEADESVQEIYLGRRSDE
nr:ATP-binding cassette domain-containing protein [Aquisalimonas sp. 2447]